MELAKLPDGAKGMVDEKHGYAYTMYKGIPYPPFMIPESIDAVRSNFPLRDSDVVIATYPKCGTTWAQQLVLLLFNDTATYVLKPLETNCSYIFVPLRLDLKLETSIQGDRSKFFNPMEDSPWLEASVSLDPANKDGAGGWKELVEKDTHRRRVWKTHAPVHLAPWKDGVSGLNGNQRVIVVTRNPNDAAVSMWHHSLDIPQFKYDGAWEHFHSLYLEGAVEHGSFWEWHKGWWRNAQADPEHILWVSFEELRRDLIGAVKRIATHISIDITDELAQKVAEASTFTSMKKQFEEMDKINEKEGKYVKKNHIRKGQVGAWRNDFTKEQEEAFKKKTEKLMEETNGLSFEFGPLA